MDNLHHISVIWDSVVGNYSVIAGVVCPIQFAYLRISKQILYIYLSISASI